jgi:hypothetical protein
MVSGVWSGFCFIALFGQLGSGRGVGAQRCQLLVMPGVSAAGVSQARKHLLQAQAAQAFQKQNLCVAAGLACPVVQVKAEFACFLTWLIAFSIFMLLFQVGS